MAGDSDTRKLIIDTLMGRPAGTDIQPEDHQAFALALNDYIRNVELNSGNAFIGFAKADTVPIQSDNGQCFYISTVPPSTNIVYANFIDSEGNPISVTTPPNKMAFVTLIWDTKSWDSQITIIETNWSQVFENNIAPEAVTGDKIASNSIDSSKIIDKTIQSDDLNPNAFDETLSTSGKIAPADVVGSKLTKLESEAIYDVSAHNNGVVFESLQSLLSNSDLDSLIPTSIRCGGMSIRFINFYNKYVQYRYTGIETTGNPNPFLDIANWRCTDIAIISESAEVKESILPNELNKWGKIKSLTINSFQGAQEGHVNEYMLEFIVSGEDFTLTLPEGIRWVEEPTWENGYTYQVSIVNNLAVFAGWEAQTNE